MSNQSTIGLVQKKQPAGGATIQESVTIPKPAFIAPTNALIQPTLKREVPVAKSIRNMSPEELTALGIVPGKLFLPTFGSSKPKKEKAPKKEKSSKTKPTSDPFMGVKFTEAHILSDEEFIKYTRAPFNVHSKGGKALFFANGGAAYLGYETLQTAFEAMRRNILAKMAGLTAGEPYKRIRDIEGEHHVFNAGTYAEAQLIRERARELARIREENAKWLVTPIKRASND